MSLYTIGYGTDLNDRVVWFPTNDAHLQIRVTVKSINFETNMARVILTENESDWDAMRWEVPIAQIFYLSQMEGIDDH